ncbi:MAG: response regulator [Caldilineaceae bacterium]|nr:response regulator [Caldilineaceae bacterium]
MPGDIEVAQSEQFKSSILIVDDAPAGRETMEALLFSPAYDLHFASSGAQALEMAAGIRPDLILLDVMMPGMDGFEVCRRLRADPELAHIPIILVTALDDRASRLQGIDSGADDFVSKPFDSAELRARVRTITRLNRYRRLVEERARFEWVVERAEDGFLLLDGDTILYANPQAKVLLELDEFDQRSEQPSFLAAVQQSFRCEPQELWARWPYLEIGENGAVLLLVAPETASSAATFLEMSIYGAALSDRHGQLVRLRNITAEKTTIRDMWSFHTMVMHKLNTPMHMMLGSMELLTLSSPDTMSKQEVIDLVESASGGARRIFDAVSDVLQFASTPSMISHIGEHFCLDDLPQLIDEISSQLGLHDVQLDADAPPEITLPISSRAMESIMFELLENSKKFHPSNAPSLTVRTALEGDRVCVTVQDDGIHLSPEQLGRVWLPYYQGERYFTGEVPGMGLGLSVVASLVWEIGGDCHIANRTDSPGVTVRLRFPFDDDA